MSIFRHCFRVFALCAAGLVCAATGALGAQDTRPSVAVLEPVANSSVSKINTMTAYAALNQYIINSKRYKVVDRSRTDQILKEHSFSRNGMVDAARAKEIGKMLQSDMVCTTEMRKEEGAFIITCSLIDVESGEVTASAYELIEADNPTEIKNAVNRAVLTMLGMDSPLPATRAAAAPAAAAPVDPLQDPKQARIAVIIPETHLTRRIPDPAGETAIIRKLLEAGFTRVVDKNQVDKIRDSDKVKAMMSGDIGAAKGIGMQLGVDYIMVGEAFSEAVGPVAGGMFSCRARVEAKLLRTDNARIIATNGFHAGGADLTESTSAKVALNNAGAMMGDYMVKQLLSGAGASTASGVRLTVTGALTYSKASEFEKALRAIKGVQGVRINEYSNSVTTIDLSTGLSVQVLAEAVGGISKPVVEVTEVSGSAMKVSMR
jgi:TolB-like protein